MSYNIFEGVKDLVDHSFSNLKDDWKEIGDAQPNLSQARKVFNEFLESKKNPDFSPNQDEIDELWKSMNLIMAYGSQSEIKALKCKVTSLKEENKDFFASENNCQNLDDRSPS